MIINWKRLGKSLLAAFIGSWLGSSVFFVVSSFVGGGMRISNFSDLAAGFGNLLLALISPYGLIAFVPMLVIGLPVQALLQRAGKTSYVSNTLLATVAGAVVLPAIFMAISLPGNNAFTSENMSMGALVAFLIGSIAWLIRRPDKDAKPSQAAA
jgi:hypothetical protein